MKVQSLLQSYACKHTRIFVRAEFLNHTRLWNNRKTLLKGALISPRSVKSYGRHESRAVRNRVCRSMHARLRAPRPKAKPRHRCHLAATTKCPAGKRGLEGGVGRMKSKQFKNGTALGSFFALGKREENQQVQLLETQRFTLSANSDLAKQSRARRAA
jgi:hypothetical protein